MRVGLGHGHLKYLSVGISRARASAPVIVFYLSFLFPAAAGLPCVRLLSTALSTKECPTYKARLHGGKHSISSDLSSL